MNGQQAQQLERMTGDIGVMEIGFKRLSEYAVLPTKAHASDSGFDLYAAEDVIIAPGETVVVPTNIAVRLPEGYEAQVRPRSGITSKTKLRVQLGTIDNGYAGDIGVIVDNIGVERDDRDYDVILISEKPSNECDTVYYIRKGDKIAQLVVQPIPQAVTVEITELGETDRGDAGFGSSGTRQAGDHIE